MTPKNYNKPFIKLTRVEVVTVAACLIAIGLLLALNRYRPRNTYVEPVVYIASEVLEDEREGHIDDSNNESDSDSKSDDDNSSNRNFALQEGLLQSGE